MELNLKNKLFAQVTSSLGTELALSSLPHP